MKRTKENNFWKGVYHKLFECPTFWQIKPSFKCPGCGKKYRCYWDGNDVAGHGRDYCNTCAAGIRSIEEFKGA